jgi:hypothetical protein
MELEVHQNYLHTGEGEVKGIGNAGERASRLLLMAFS